MHIRIISMEHLRSINNLLNQPNTFSRNLDSILILGNQIIKDHEDTNVLFGESNVTDELRPILAAISGTEANNVVPFEADLVLIRILKVLLRKPANRLSLGRNELTTLVRALTRLQVERRNAAVAELCNVVLNSCYDGANVQSFIELDGLKPLIALLRSRDVIVQASTLGVLQGLSFVPSGRQKIRQEPMLLPKVAVFLSAEDTAVRARAVGVLHNISVDMISIIPITDTGCVSVLVQMLADSSTEICTAVAGTLQNLARDSVTRECIIECGALESLSDLLFASDIDCQVAAVASMLNLLGPDVPATKRQDYCKLLTDALVLGAVRSSVFDIDLTSIDTQTSLSQSKIR